MMMDNRRYVPGMGPIGAKLAFVGEAPFTEEVVSGRPFDGPAGRELDKLCRNAGINRGDCWVTNVVKHMIPLSDETGKRIPLKTRCEMVGINLEEQK